MVTLAAVQDDGGVANGGANTTFYNLDSIVAISATNDAPTFAALDGNPTFIEGGTPVVLDGNVTINDAELSAADNFDGATLTLVRNGGADADDVFSATGTLAALTEGGNRDFELVEMEGLNHLFQKCETGSIVEYATIDETFNPAALKRIGDWIVERTSILK